MMIKKQMAYRRADCVLQCAAAIVIGGLAVWAGTAFDQYTVSIPAPLPAPLARVAVAPLPALTVAKEDQSECLAEVLYYEARGEGTEGEKAVAEVVLQRTRDH